MFALLVAVAVFLINLAANKQINQKKTVGRARASHSIANYLLAHYLGVRH